jgi:hypothetical protein
VIVDDGLNIDTEMRARTSWKASFALVRVAIPTVPLPMLALGEVATLTDASAETATLKRGFAYGDHLIYGLYHDIDPSRGQFGTTVFLERRGVYGS